MSCVDARWPGFGWRGQPLAADYVPGVVTIGGTRPRLNAIKADGNGGVQITLVGKAGPSYRLESSEDLTRWSTVTVVPNSTGTVQFTDPNPMRVPSRFYRAVQQP